MLACDLHAGLVMALRPYDPSPAWQVLGKVPNPAHAEVVDLDGDGVKDVLVAYLGSSEPTDRRTGSVVWLRGGPDGRFTPVTLLEGVGRVADVQAADFRGDGKLDLVVAVFGWRDDRARSSTWRTGRPTGRSPSSCRACSTSATGPFTSRSATSTATAGPTSSP